MKPEQRDPYTNAVVPDAAPAPVVDAVVDTGYDHPDRPNPARAGLPWMWLVVDRVTGAIRSVLTKADADVTPEERAEKRRDIQRRQHRPGMPRGQRKYKP